MKDKFRDSKYKLRIEDKYKIKVILDKDKDRGKR